VLELYGSGDPATLKLLICLEELRLDYRFRLLDLKKLDHWSASHRAMAPQGEIPVLVDGDRVMADATITLLYLAESHREAKLLPSDPSGRYDVQALGDVLDAALLGSVNLVGWHRQNDDAARKGFGVALSAVPGRQEVAGWSAVWRDAESDRLKRAEEKIGDGVAKARAALGTRPWLVGEDFTVADISAFALIESLGVLIPGAVGPLPTPQLSAWLDRMRARPAVVRALARAGRSAGEGPCYAPPA
jgi:glutathione S-transferase